MGIARHGAGCHCVHETRPASVFDLGFTHNELDNVRSNPLDFKCFKNHIDELCGFKLLKK